MQLEELMSMFNKNSIFRTHDDGAELLEHLLKGTLSQAEISRRLGKSDSAICQYKKQISKYVDKLKPHQKELIKEQSQALAETSDINAVMSLEEMGEILQKNINECTEIIHRVHVLIPLTDDNAIAIQHLRLKAMEKIEKTIAIYFDRYGSLSEVKASAELKKIKDKVGKTITFLITSLPNKPELVREYIEFLDEKEEEEPDE